MKNKSKLYLILSSFLVLGCGLGRKPVSTMDFSEPQDHIPIRALLHWKDMRDSLYRLSLKQETSRQVGNHVCSDILAVKVRNNTQQVYEAIHAILDLALVGYSYVKVDKILLIQSNVSHSAENDLYILVYKGKEVEAMLYNLQEKRFEYAARYFTTKYIQRRLTKIRKGSSVDCSFDEINLAEFQDGHLTQLTVTYNPGPEVNNFLALTFEKGWY
ncbi:MAG: hypothetical protein IT260_03400 [Saprospiraceae bacterium]|nr:hypothetical protein [Saprospiraceae bacterium]